ncbi:DinB family protein [Halalkalibacillus halophilus]|uniref:DinB family protein n=1 Tax=Halalkalibacillus halophilus TaxID=392827 RepID=UPI0004031448|nr:DinB family protein [Halalkalibacillus halophilus]
MSEIITQFEQTADDILALKGHTEAALTEPIAEGKWSAREIIAHMQYWDQYNLEHIVPHMKQGKELPSFPDHDAQNEEAILFIKDDSMEALFEKFVTTRRDLVEHLRAVDPEVTFTFGKGKREINRDTFTEIFVKHDQHHLEQMQTKLDR